MSRRLAFERLEDRTLLTTIDLAALLAGQGTTLCGADADDGSGWSVSAAGAGDIARLFDSPSHDRFTGYGNVAQIVGPAAIYRGIGFETVRINGTGGINRRSVFPPLAYTLSQVGTWIG